MTDAARPILVTGSHRSGTTWVGRLLALGGEVEVIHEPFHPHLYHSWLRHPPERWYQYLDEGGQASFAEDLDRALRFRPALAAMARRAPRVSSYGGVAREALKAGRARLLGRRPLIKDPIAFFAAEWIAARFLADTVVLVRHPAAFASSLKRLGWNFDFNNLVDQPSLMEHHLAPFQDELGAATRQTLDLIDQAVLLWRVVTHTSLAYRDRHPEWIVARYEDLASDPKEAFEALYSRLGLRWSPRVRHGVETFTQAANGAEVPDGDPGTVRRDSRHAMWTWSDRLTDDEVRRVRVGTADVADRIYGPDSWRPPTKIRRDSLTSGRGLEPC